MKVLITGGAGYIGSHCNFYFSEYGIETVVLDDLSTGHREAVLKGRLIIGDFGDQALLEKIFSAEKFDAVIHFAALADVVDSVKDPAKYYETNVAKMMTLLNCMVKYDIKNIVFSSSAAIFGEPRYIPIDEHHEMEPVNPYGETKLIGEKMLADYENAYDIKYCCLRYFNAAGAHPEGILGEAHEPEHHILPLIFQTALKKRDRFYVFGNDYDTKDGTCLRDYIHVMDLAEAHYLALKYIMENNISEAFNLGSGAGFTVLEMIEMFEEISNMKLNFQFAGRRLGDPARLLASNKKAREILNLKLEKSNVETIIQDAWEWEKNRHY